MRNASHVSSLDRAGYQYMGVKTLEGGIDYAPLALNVEMQAPAQTPTSLSVSSVCLGSGCVGSICFGSACVGSICFGSACASTSCGGSVCVQTACGGSACVASACGGSACVGSVCFGSACMGSMCMGNCGGESFPLVGAFDYTAGKNGVEIVVAVSSDAQLVGAERATALSRHQLNKVFVPGAFTSVAVDNASADGALVFVLTARDGSQQRMTVNALAANS